MDKTTLGLVALVALVASESLAIATVMPLAAAELHGLPMYGLVFGAPLAASVLGMVAAGTWSDRGHPAAPLLAGLACFVCGLVLGGFAPDMAWLVAGRIATGFGDGMLAVAVYALVGRLYPEAQRPRVFTLFSAAWVLPALCAPAVSGWAAERFGWRAVILALSLFALPAAALLVPTLRETRLRASLPWLSTRLLWAAGAGVAALALHYAGQAGGRLAASATIIAAACAVLAICAKRLLPPGTLRARRGLPAGLALQGASQAAFFAAEAFLPLVLVQQRGLSVGTAGAVLTAGALVWSGGAACRVFLRRFLSTSSLLAFGMALVASGIALAMALLLPGVPVAAAIVGWALAGFGMGTVSPTLSLLTLSLSSPERHGETGAALRLSAALSTTAALAVNGALFALLIARSPALAYSSTLAAALALALLGIAVARRTEA